MDNAVIYGALELQSKEVRDRIDYYKNLALKFNTCAVNGGYKNEILVKILGWKGDSIVRLDPSWWCCLIHTSRIRFLWASGITKLWGTKTHQCYTGSSKECEELVKLQQEA